MCFAPQRRAIFWHRNFQTCSETGVLCAFWLRRLLRAKQWCVLFEDLNFEKCSDNEVFCAFWLRTVLSATMACTFWHLNFQRCSEHAVVLAFWLPHVLRAAAACNFWSQIAQTLGSYKTWEKHSVSGQLLFRAPWPSFSMCPYCRKFDF